VYLVDRRFVTIQGASKIPAVFLLAALGARPALADEPPSGPLFRSAVDAPRPSHARMPLRLDYQRGPGADACPERATVAAAIAVQLGYDPFDETAAERLSVAITREGDQFVVRVEQRDARGAVRWSYPPTRHPDCAQLVGALAIATAIQIDPFSLPPGSPPQAPAVPVPLPAPPPPIVPAPTPTVDRRQAEPPPKDRPLVRVGLAGAMEAGIAPAITAGFLAQVGVRWRYVSVAAEGRVDVPTSSSEQVMEQATARLMLGAGSVVTCGHLPLPIQPRGWNVAGCALLTLGAIYGQSEGASIPKSGSVLYAGAGGRLGLEVPVGGSVALRVFGDMTGTIPNITVLLPGNATFVVPRATGGAGIGVVADF
jgi:hypothetical protein